MPIICSICMEGLIPFFTENPPEIISTVCGHVYHSSCLMNWFDKKPTCPQCRSVISLDSCNRLYIQITTPSPNECDDVFSLKAQIETLKFENKMCESTTSKKEEELQRSIQTNAVLRQKVIDAEQVTYGMKSSLLSLKEHVKELQQKIIVLSTQIEELEILKQKINYYVWIDDLLNGIPSAQAKEVNISAEECKKLFIHFRRIIREEREMREAAMKDKTELDSLVLSKQKMIIKQQNEIKLLKDVIDAYKSKSHEPPGTPSQNNSQLASDFANDNYINPPSSSGTQEQNAPALQASSVIRQPKLSSWSKSSPSLASKFKVVSKRRKLL